MVQHDEHVWEWRRHRQGLAGFYAWLAAHQERLDRDMEEILYANLPDLYAR